MSDAETNFMDEVAASAKQALADWHEARQAFEKAGFDLAKSTDGLGMNDSLGDLDDQVRTILRFISALRLRPDDSYHLVHDSELTKLRTGLKGASSNAQGIVTALAKYDATAIVITDQKKLTYSAAGTVQSLASYTTTVYASIQQALAAVLAIAPALRVRGVSDLRHAARAYEMLTETLDERAQESEKLLDLIRKREKSSNTSAQNVESMLGNSTISELNAAAAASNASEKFGEAQQIVGRLREILQQSGTLESQIEKYEADFKAFQQQLDDKFKSIGDLEERLTTLQTELEASKSEIESTTTKAEGMLAGATVAGLSTSFAEALESYHERLGQARNGFYFAIFVLFVGVVPLALYIVGFQIYSQSFVSNFQVTFPGILGRLALLIPGTWLARMQAKRYYDLFALHQQYALKTALARALDGFKKQAPEYEDEMAAAVLDLLADDEYALGVRRKAGEARDPNRLMKAVLDRLEGHPTKTEEPE